MSRREFLIRVSAHEGLKHRHRTGSGRAHGRKSC